MVVALVRVCGLKHAGLEVDGEAGWVVGAGQVVAGGAALRVRGGGGEHAAVLLDRHHAALVADRVHRVLVRVRRLEQAALANTLGYHRAKYFLEFYDGKTFVSETAAQKGSVLFSHRQLEVELAAAGLDLLGVVEPLDLAHHAARPGLPQHLDLADVGPVAAPRREEDGAVVDVERVLAALDRLEEELFGLALAAGPLVALARPAPQLAAGHAQLRPARPRPLASALQQRGQY